MLKKIGFALVGLLALAALSYSGAHYPDVCQTTGETGSILCAGLIEHYELNEASDRPRFGAGMSFLQETPGQNVAQALDGSTNVADFDGTTTKWLWANVTAPSDSFTITFRVKVKTLGSASQQKSIISWINNNFIGPEIYWLNNAGQGLLCITVFEAETATAGKSACQNATAGTWYFVTVGASRYHDGKSNIWIALDNNAPTTTAVTYWQHGGGTYMRISGRAATGPADASTTPADMLLSKLAFHSRPISDYERVLLYNGSKAPSGALAFPYDTN